MEDGPIISVDGKSGKMYAIIQPAPTGPQSFENATGCGSGGGGGCATGSFCCRDPTEKGASAACFGKPCQEIPISGGVNTSEPFRLVEMDLTDHAKVTGSPKLCTIKGQDCPWSLDAF